MSPIAKSLEQTIRELVRDELARAKEGETLVDQLESPLGRRRHVRIAQKLIAAGDKRAGRAGKKFFMTRGAIEEQLHRMGREQVGEVDDAAEEREGLLSELGLRVVNGGRK